MFSTSVNQGDDFPIETAALLERNTDPASPYWMVPLADGGFDSGFFIGAGTDYNGNPTSVQSAVNLKNGYTAIIRWIAPADGYYHVRASWKCHDTAGTFSSTQDGLTVSVYKDNLNLFSKDITGRLAGWDTVYPKWNNNGDTVKMKKGESLYFISDPKNDGAGDTPWIILNISYEGDKMIYAAPKKDANDFSWTPEKELEIGDVFYWGDGSINSFTQEGEQGFFAMYGTAVAQGENYPVNTLKKCEFDDFTNYWKIPENDDYSPRFRIGSSLTDTHPAIMPTNGRTAAIKWVAPKDGTYTVKYVNFGNWNNKNSLSGSDDGVTVGVYCDDGENIYSKTYKKDETIVYNDVVWNDPSWFVTTLTLQKGEPLYFVGDPNNDATGDNPWCHIKIILKNMQAKDFNAVEEDWVPQICDDYYFGDEAFNAMNKQGMQNFYTMYLAASDYADKFPTFALKPMQLFKLEPRQWVPGSSSMPWMFWRATGEGCLEKDRSIAIKWLAPEDGTYYIDAFVFQGTKQGYKEDSGEDGISYGIYHGTQNLVYMDKDATSYYTRAEAEADSEQHMKTEVAMKKGEALFFTADSKKILAGSDIPALRIRISTSSPDEKIDYMAGMLPFENTDSAAIPESPNKLRLVPIIVVSAVLIAAIGGVIAFVAIKKHKGFDK